MKKNQRPRNVRLQGLALLLSVVLLFVFLPVSAATVGAAPAPPESPTPPEEDTKTDTPGRS